MPRQVFALLPSSEEEPVVLAIAKGRGWEIVSPEHFSPSSDDQAVAFAPATSVTHHRAQVSARSEREALTSVPYLIEDELAYPVELLHVAIGKRAPDNQMRDVYVVDRRILEAWLGELDRIGLGKAKIVPELALLPEGPLIVDLGDRRLVALRDRRYGIDLSLQDDLVRALTMPGGEQIPVDPLEGHPLAKLINMMPGEVPMDLRQGPFSQRAPGFNFDLQSVHVPFALAASCLVAWMGYIAVETSVLKHEAQILRADASRQYTALFPQETNVEDPEQRIRQKTIGLGQSDLDFRSASAALYEAVLATKGAEIRAIRYERAQGLLRATLSYGAYGDDAKVRQYLLDAGLEVNIGDSRQEQDRVVGDLTLEPKS